MSTYAQRSEASKAYGRKLRSEIYYWYRSKGLCPRCGTRYAEPGFAFCGPCKKHMAALAERRDPGAVKRKAYNIERRKKLKEEGICVDCGKARAIRGQTRCAECARRMRESRKRWRILQQMDREAEEAKARNGTCNT